MPLADQPLHNLLAGPEVVPCCYNDKHLRFAVLHNLCMKLLSVRYSGAELSTIDRPRVVPDVLRQDPFIERTWRLRNVKIKKNVPDAPNMVEFLTIDILRCR
jgi:hypothetical protein